MIRRAGAWFLCWLALAMVGCAPGVDGLKQSISKTSIIVAGGYRARGVYDVKRQIEIRESAISDAKAAASKLAAHLNLNDMATKALNDGADAIDGATKFVKLYDQGAAKSKDIPLWIANLAAAALSVSTALHDMGVY